MNLAALLIPPSLDAKQALRLRRLGLAVLIYAATLLLVTLAWIFSALPGATALEMAALYVLVNCGVYAAIRSGYNLRFADPSLTRFQMLAAITLLMYAIYYLNYGRHVSLLVVGIVLLFGVFRLNTREYTLVTLYTLAAYALVLDLLMYLRPQTIDNVPLEWMSWLMLAGILPSFTVVGGSINTLRQKLRESAASLRVFSDNIPVMTVSWDENLRCRFANRPFTEFFGFTADNIIGKHLREVVGEEAYAEIEGHFARVRQGHPVTYERTRTLPGGKFRHLEVRLLPHLGDDGRIVGYFAVTTDITERKLTEERIRRMAHHDSLTGLPNRLLFNDRLNQALRLAKRDARLFALLYLDLDKFKPVNDTLGHAAGDQLLQAVAARIQREMRESDTVARVGGDEFTVILPDIARREEAATVAAKIIAALAAPFQLGPQWPKIEIGTSIGIAVYPADGGDADALVKAADIAMYNAKIKGAGYRFFAP